MWSSHVDRCSYSVCYHHLLKRVTTEFHFQSRVHLLHNFNKLQTGYSQCRLDYQKWKKKKKKKKKRRNYKVVFAMVGLEISLYLQLEWLRKHNSYGYLVPMCTAIRQKGYKNLATTINKLAIANVPTET